MSTSPAGNTDPTLITQESPVAECVVEWDTFPTPQTLARHLPLEMLQEIFVWVLSDDVLDVFNTQNSPRVVGRVCRSWRTASSRCARLWARTLLVNLGKARLCRNPTEMLRDVLGRTGALDFGIILQDPIPGDDSRPFRQLVALLAERSLQWDTLMLNRVSPDVLRAVLPEASGCLPRLRRLDFRLCSVSGLSFEDCPLLRHVSFECIEPSGVALPYSQLTSFSSYNTYAAVDSPIRALDILKVSPNLVVFETDPDQSYYVGSPIPSSFIHENLTNLITCDMGLLQCLTLPNLESLAVMSTCHKPFPSRLLNALPAILHLLERSNCQLSSLLLHDCQLMPQMIKRVFTLVPGLSELIINFSTSVDNMTFMGMAAISARMYADDLLPLLERFVYSDSTLMTGALLFFNDDFMAMLLKRSRSDQYGLRSIHISLLASDLAVAVERMEGRLHSQIWKTSRK
ncbi:hypothetical protein BDZ89DRAFT_1111760 [Hymenopellis radicata]|nr:hypothetical protein BDZ89DRAFT_1111760 [Hymenopellis radicata]